MIAEVQVPTCFLIFPNSVCMSLLAVYCWSPRGSLAEFTAILEYFGSSFKVVQTTCALCRLQTHTHTNLPHSTRQAPHSHRVLPRAPHPNQLPFLGWPLRLPHRLLHGIPVNTPGSGPFAGAASARLAPNNGEASWLGRCLLWHSTVPFTRRRVAFRHASSWQPFWITFMS